MSLKLNGDSPGS